MYRGTYESDTVQGESRRETRQDNEEAFEAGNNKRDRHSKDCTVITILSETSDLSV